MIKYILHIHSLLQEVNTSGELTDFEHRLRSQSVSESPLAFQYHPMQILARSRPQEDVC